MTSQNNFIINVATTDAVAVSRFADHLRGAVDAMDSSQPDSLGDRLFRAWLAYCHQRNSGAVSAEVLKSAVEPLNEFEGLRHEALVERTGLTHYRRPVWVVEECAAA